MGTRWALAPPQGSGSLSTAATGSFTERWQLGLPGTATRAGGAAEADTWWGEGLVSHSGCLCLWVTANSGFQMMPKLPGLWVQIRNLQHLAEDRTGLGSNAWAEYSFLFLWLVAATLAMVNLQQTLVKLQAAWTGQDRTWAYTRRRCSAPRPRSVLPAVHTP